MTMEAVLESMECVSLIFKRSTSQPNGLSFTFDDEARTRSREVDLF